MRDNKILRGFFVERDLQAIAFRSEAKSNELLHLKLL